MPIFEADVLETLKRNGITAEDALADLQTARELPDTAGKLILAGQLALYECMRRPIFGRVDLIVIKVFV